LSRNNGGTVAGGSQSQISRRTLDKSKPFIYTFFENYVKIVWMSIFYIIGIVGAILLLFGFIVRKNKKIGVGTVFFNVLNLFGSTFLTLYAWDGAAWPFFILNGVWAIDSAVALIKG